MLRITSPFCMAAAMVIAVNSAFAQTATFDQRAKQGRDLFVHQWQPNDPLTPNGDGLGPVYNATSCVACHSQGGIGGAGSPANNVELLAVLPDPGQPTIQTEKAFMNRLESLHPMFVDKAGNYYIAVLLHRYSTTNGYDDAYQELTQPLAVDSKSRAWIRRMLRRRGMSFVSQLPLRLVATKKEMQFAIAERNPPQLFGVDLIDRYIDDTDIIAIANSQKGSESGVSGRFTGRYGWRGQMNDLDAFVKGACAAELGLQVEDMPQAPDPMRLDYKLEKPDLNSDQTSNLVAFVRSLPRPELVLPDDPNHRSYVNQGKLLFSQVGCAECHVENVGELDGVFSDFLLHDMGSEFEDPVPAPEVPSYVVTAGTNDVKIMPPMPPYYGISPTPPPSDVAVQKDGNWARTSASHITFESIEERNHYREYRTPPLWGVADSGPYLHDGRAKTLRAAIEWHGGEAYRSMMAFSSLSEEQQTAVLKFLEALKAPKDAEQAPDRLADEDKPAPPANDKLSSLR